jgi:hypothetical protein
MAKDLDLIWVSGEAENFFEMGLDEGNHVEPVQQIPLCAQTPRAGS